MSNFRRVKCNSNNRQLGKTSHYLLFELNLTQRKFDIRATYKLKAVFHCSRFARPGGANDFNLVKNQSRGHAKKVKCSSTSKRVRAHKSGQKTLRLDTYSKS